MASPTGKSNSYSERKKEASIKKWFKAHIQQKKRPSGDKLSFDKPSPSKSLEIDIDNQTEITSENNDELTNLLHEWIWVKTKLCITILGEKGVGKSFLANTLLEATFQNYHQNSAYSSFTSLDKDFFLIGNETKSLSIPSVKGDPMQVTPTH